MRWSQLFIPTLKEDPSAAETASHKLLMRAGYIRPLGSGIYSLLPLAQRVRLKVINMIREEMNAIGGQEFVLPALHPIEPWEESGRLGTMGDIMFRLRDRKGAELVLGVTHEEIFTSIARSALSSYRQLPQIWYQFQTKFRDELRPKSGLLRVREFTMKDSYSFDVDAAGLDKNFDQHKAAYERIFERAGLHFVAVEASSGAMGGSASTEFMVLTDAGEDLVVLCKGCGYAANLEKAVAAIEEIEGNAQAELEKFPTPGLRTVEQLASFADFASAKNQIKTLVYVADDQLVLVLLQGDHELNTTKLMDFLGAENVRPAEDQEIFSAMGAHAGSLGGVGVKTLAGSTIKRLILDNALKGRSNMVTGANHDDFHYKGVSIERDIEASAWSDFRSVKSGDSCIKCGGALSVEKSLEIGHIFKLGTRYSTIMDAHVLLASGEKTPIVMGSYGIGVERLMAAAVERSHDKKGIIWPQSLAPYDVIVNVINSAEQESLAAGEKLYSELRAQGLDVLLDDRKERPGFKFADNDLIGIPLRVNIGKKLKDGIVELVERATGENKDVSLHNLVDIIKQRVTGAL
ncbi:MAG: proline--tRNA ligase [Candidatus Melainabacteria bacterium]|nr:proline--tRNA ligase [Candidatus Melainabacteria bacterium]